jgi:hypothetical protein
MSRPSEDDREAVDRAFADLVAGYHLTSDRPDPLEQQVSIEQAPGDQTAPGQTRSDPMRGDQARPDADGVSQPAPETGDSDQRWADDHPLFRYEEPQPVAEDDPVAEERFVPEPLPLPRPAWPVLLAWIAMGYAVVTVLAAAMGLDLPRWAAWLTLVAFVGGFGLLVTRLPRHRPPDAGNGAVL